MGAPDPAAALLALVAEDRDRRIAACAAESARAIQAMLAEARRTARERVHEALAGERERLRRHRVSADAALATAQRRHESRHVALLLARGFERLAVALAARWAAPAGRAEWAARVLRLARATLGAGPWRIEHAPGWAAAERLAATDVPAGSTFAEDARTRGGLRVRAAGNVIDGTLESLLGDREAVGARMLEHLREGRP